MCRWSSVLILYVLVGFPALPPLPAVMMFTQIMNMLQDWGPSLTSVTTELHRWGEKREEEILGIILTDK